MSEEEVHGRRPPPVVPGYEILKELGHGGFATVYRARQVSVDREVAVKVVSVQLSSDTERRFRAECRAIGQLSWHPHIVPLYDAGVTTDGTPFLVMELMSGGSLADRIQGGTILQPPEVVDAGAQIADALGDAHNAGVVHRDVKPANCLVDRRGIVRLGDFGIAVLQDESLTATASFVGTVAYTAPEVLRGDRASPRSDVYALGATLYELAAGRSPFSRDTPNDSPAAVMWRVANEPCPPLPATVPQGLTDILDQAMAKEADRRQASAHILRDQLQSVKGETSEENHGATRIDPTGEAGGGDEDPATVPMPAEADVPTRGADEEQTSSNFLRVRYGENSRDVILIGENVTVGRSTTNAVSVPSDGTMSSQHAVLYKRPNGWWLRDSNSANGTTVNGTRLAAEHLLQAEDEILLGSSLLTFRAGVPGGRSQSDDVSQERGNDAVEDPVILRPPVSRPRRGRGHVRGLARSVQTRQTPQARVVLSFRVDSYDESGVRLDSVAVELRNYRSGRVGDGEEVDVTGKWDHGTLRADKIIDVSTQAQVRRHAQLGKGGCLLALLILVVLLASALKMALIVNGGWHKGEGHGSCPAPSHLTFFC